MRRYMMKIAEHFAKKDGCLGLITGESIGQVASQTMQSLAATNAVCTLPVYRPLIGFDKKDIVEISEKINRMPMNYFDTTTHGEVLSRVTNDVDTLSQSLNQSATQMITSVTTIIGVLIMMISISPLMTVIALLILPVSMVLISVIVKHSQKYFKSQQEYLGHINGQVEEVYGGHNIVKAFNKDCLLYTSPSPRDS